MISRLQFSLFRDIVVFHFTLFLASFWRPCLSCCLFTSSILCILFSVGNCETSFTYFSWINLRAREHSESLECLVFIRMMCFSHSFWARKSALVSPGSSIKLNCFTSSLRYLLICLDSWFIRFCALGVWRFPALHLHRPADMIRA